MTIQPTDIALIVISLVACVYCFLLGRKLKALQNTNDGLGATIAAFTKATAEISAATHQSCQRASQQATKLSGLIGDAEATCQKLRHLADDTERRLGVATEQSRETSRAIELQLDEILKDAKEQNSELTALTEQMRVLSSQTTDAIRNALVRSASTQPQSVPTQPQRVKKPVHVNDIAK